MASFFLIAILVYSSVILAVLFYVDLKTRLLPNRYVVQFFCFGLAFHIISGFSQIVPLDMVIACVASGGLLLLIRAMGNKFYGTDTLGMGDVKLIGSAGIWLGSEYIFLAVSLGALAGVIHGLGLVVFSRVVMKKEITLRNLSIPAGPGFIIGIVICAVLKYYGFITAMI